MRIVGVDVGGTTIRVAEVDPASGRSLATLRAPTAAPLGPDAAIRSIIGMVGALVAKGAGPLAALGIGITGPVDPHTGVVSNPHTLDGWPPTDFRRPFLEALGCPVAVDNDANVAALGEHWAGAGRNAARLAMVTIGTGIGVGLLIDGRVQRAADGRHGEAGHMVLDRQGPACYCGARGCWEVLASGLALDRRARELAADPASGLRELAADSSLPVDAGLLFAADAAGVAVATRTLDAAADVIGLGLVNLAAAFMPDRIVVGGGLSTRLDRLQPRMEAVLRRHAVMIPTDVPVVPALLGDDAGAIGAAGMARDIAASECRATGQDRPMG